MKKRAFSLLIALTLLISCMSFVQVTSAAPTVKNIIYMIPDGGGYGPYDFANMVKTNGGFLKYPNKTPTTTDPLSLKDYLTGSVITEPYGGGVTDSAAAGTALATGRKTYNSYLGVDNSGKPVANLVEAAQSTGRATGLVATYEWMHATPAAFSAHAMDRNEYKNLYEQIENKGIDVVLGAGYGAVAEYATIQNAVDRGYTVVKNKADLAKVQPGDKIWGDIANNSMPYDIELIATQPTLSEMTSAAITALSGDEDGFFLMVEGSKVDTGGHANDAVVTTSEYLAFDAAFKTAVDFAKGRNDTVVIAAPDHDTGGMMLKDNMAAEIASVQNGSDPSTINWESYNHTGQNVGVWIYLPEGVDTIPGFNSTLGDTPSTRTDYVLQNTVIAPYLANLMGVDLDALSSELFVDVTNIGIYRGDTQKFTFYNGNKYAYRNQSVYYKDGQEISMNGKEMLFLNSRVYLPADIIEEADWTATGGTVGDPSNVLNGTGTKDDPYLIEDAIDFFTFTNEMIAGNNYYGKYLKQTANIDLAGYDNYTGVGSAQSFNGVYDGGGYIINADMSVSADNALFPYTWGTIMNLGTTGTINSYGSLSAGIVRSLREGAKMVNCYSTVNISGTNVRGLACSNYSIISNCYFAGTITASGEKSPISNSGTYENCYYVDTCGATQEAEGVTAITEEVATTTLAAMLNDGRQAAADSLGVSLEEISDWGQNEGTYPNFMKSIPVIESVSVSPATATITKGGSLKLKATVTGQNNPSQKVKWSIEPQSKFSGTTITDDGVLTVDRLETMESFTVLAKSVQDGGKAGAARIEVSSLVFDFDFTHFPENATFYDNAGGARLWLSSDTEKKSPEVTTYKGLSEDGNASYISFAPGATSFSGSKNGRPVAAAVKENVLGQHELTIETWARSTPFSGRWDRIFALGSDGAEGHRLDIEINEGSTTFRVGLGNDENGERRITSDRNFWNGEWQHIVMNRKYNNGTLVANVYVNGELIGSETVNDAQDPAIWERDKWEVEQEYKVLLGIGGQSGGNAVFHGDIASFRMYDKVLTADEITDNYVSGKKALQPLVVTNLDLSGYDGTAASMKDTGAFGDSSNLCQSDFVQKGTFTNIKGEEVPYLDAYQVEEQRGRAWILNDAYGELEDYTVGAWVRIPDYRKRSWGTIIAHTDRNAYDSKVYGTEFSDNSFNLRAWDIQGNYVSIEPYQDTWAYMTFTKAWTKNENNEDVLTLKAYLNGQELTDATASGVAYKDAYMGYTAFGLGSFFWSPYDGGTLIDFASFTVYGKAFSADEVAAEYAAMRDDYAVLAEIDVNFDNFDGVNASTLSNRNEETNAEFTVLAGEGAEGAKEVKEFASVNGTTKYLAVDQSKDHRLLVTSPAISNQENISIEMWARYNEGWGRFFSATPQLQQHDGGQYMDTWLDASDDDRSRIVFYPFGNDSADNGQGVIEGRHFEHDWTHFVFNRKLVSEENGVGQYIIEIYQNGVLKTSGSCEKEVTPEDYLTFTIMGSGYCGTAKTDLGSFIIRNKTLTANEIAATYEAEKDNYKPASVAITAEKAENNGYDVTVNNNFSDNIDCTLFLAAYDATTNAYAGCDIAIFTDGIDGGNSASDNLLVETLDPEKAYNFKLFVWDSITGMTPYVKPISFICENPDGEEPDTGSDMPKLLVDMDLSSYDGTAASITDATGNSAVFSQSEHVKKGTFVNASGNEVAFLDYYHDGDMRGRAWVTAPITEGLEKETISCWTRIPSEAMSWGALVAKVDAMGTDTANFEVHLNSDGMWTRPAGSYSDNEQLMLSINPYIDEWTMITFTREWNGNVVTWKTYVNGVLQDVAACSGTMAQNKKIQGFYTYGLSSKFWYEGDGGPLNDFADFQVYDGILSADQVAELYESTCQNYK